MLENPMCMIRVFERSGISLKTDESEHKKKMYFRSEEVGIREGLEI